MTSSRLRGPEPVQLRGMMPDAMEQVTLTIDGASVTVPNPVEAPGLGLGARPYLRFLPQGVRKSWLRLTFAVTPVDSKTVSKGRIFAALTREEDLPYEPAIMAG